MNELIKELMVKASSGACYDGNTPALYGHEPVNEIEEFAKLIVRECCDQFIDMQHKFHPSICAHEIKDHFGVNE